MITLNIGNSYSQITGLTTTQQKSLSKLLSYTPGGSNAYFSGSSVYRRSLLSKRGEFASGLLKRVQKWLISEKLDQVRYISSRVSPSHLYNPIFRGPTPYVDQLLAVEAAEHYCRGIISWPTGTGKSLIIALIAARLGVKTLVVVPTTGIRDQLRKDLDNTFTDAKFIDVYNIDSPKLKTATNYGCLIIDEAHHSASKTYRNLNKTAWNKIYYRFFMTATPFRNDDEEKLLFESICGQVIHRLTYQQAVAKKYIVPIEVYYIDIPKQKTDAYTWDEVYKELVVNNATRNALIASLIMSLEDIDKSTLCLVKEIAHGKILTMKAVSTFANGEDEDSKRFIQEFNDNTLKGLIATTGVCGEGINTRPCEYVIIAGLGKSKSQLMQQVGRTLRIYPGKESGKVILIRDKSHKFTLRHYNAQAKILWEEYGVKPVKLNV